jgi:hypothetical protein
MRLAAALLLTVAAAVFAQKPVTPSETAATTLPVTHVSLYKNGVGFFEHTGHVSGNTQVTIDFTSDQLNDVLQSLTAIDLNGGHVTGAGYNSTTPLAQQLKNLPIALGENPTAADFYSAIRGARVEVHSGAVSITGRLLSVEARSLPAKSADDVAASSDRYFLTVVADSGEVRTVELTPATTVRIVEGSLHTDVSRYLELLNNTRSQGLRHLTLDDRGTGARELRVSYISEVPIWKSTYRILFTDDAKTATLQGWSVVDNTTGTDWLNVQLSLIAGAPQSFIQPLSQPIYARRPEIPIAQEAQLTPQTHDSSMASDSVDDTNSAVRVMGGPVNYAAIKTPPLRGRSVGAGVMGGIAGGSGSGAAFGVAPPPPAPREYAELAETSIAPDTKTAAFDDFFAYNLTDPVTIRKNESALVPILQAKVPADVVTLVSSNGSAVQQPLRALWITNTTNLTLDRGSFSLIENGAFGGEGLLDPIHPGEKRLLSYAADQAVHVTTESQNQSNRVDHVTASKGVLVLHRAEVREVTYVIHNAATTTRTIVLEHPVQQGFTLDSDTKPEETTPTVYRFRVSAAPGETVRLHVGVKHRGVTQYQLTRSDESQLALIVQQSNGISGIEAALAPILEARRHVADAQTAVNQTTDRMTALRNDEDRQRANITALQNADKASRDRFVHDLNKTEDDIAAAQAELATRTTALEAAKAELVGRIEALQMDDKL